MKRISASLFLAIFLAGLLGPYCYFVVRLHHIRQEMRAELRNKPADELAVLRMSAAEFEQALVGDDEVKVNGRMFDIARVENVGSEVYVYCLHDEDEDNLLTLIDSVLKNASRDKKSSPLPLAGFITTLDETSPQITPPPHTNNKAETRYLHSQSDSFLAVHAPPPRTFFLS